MKALREQYLNDPDIQRMYNSAYRTWSEIQLKLTAAEQAVADGRLEDAVAQLAELRHGFPNNPDWKSLWLRADIDHGWAVAEAGRQSMLDHAFDDARVAFETALASFQSALVVFPGHPSAGPSRYEVRALEQVAAQASQAAREIRQENWESARQALDAARQHLAEAVQVRRREFSEIAAVLNAMWGRANLAVMATRSERAASADPASVLISDLTVVGMMSELAVPLRTENERILGGLFDSYYQSNHAWSQAKIDILEGLAQQAAHALDHARFTIKGESPRIVLGPAGSGKTMLLNRPRESGKSKILAHMRGCS